MTEREADGLDVDALLQWVNRPSWAESQAFLAGRPQLVSERAVAELHRQGAVQPRATQVLMLDDHAWLLRLCRETGVAEGYARYHQVIEQAAARRPEAEQAELRHTVTGEPGALETALQIRRAIDAAVTGTSRSRIRAARLDLGRLLLRRYQRDGRLADLDEAVAVTEAAWRIPGAVPRTRAAVTELLARGLRMRFEHTGTVDDLDRGLAVLDEALAALPEDSSALPDLLAVQGEALRLRYGITGDRADLDRSIEAFTRADGWVAEVVARRPARLGDLATGLLERYQATGAWDDLDRATTALDAAVAATSVGSPDRVAHTVNLAAALLLRHDREGATEDLLRARGLLEEADARLGPTSPLRPVVHGTLAACLRTLYGRTGEVTALHQGIEHAEAAAATSPTPGVAATHLAQLAHLLVARAQRDAELPAEGRPSALADLDRAVHSYERVLAATPAASARGPERLAGLGIGLAERYLRSGVVADLDRAVEVLREAVGATAPGALNEAGDRLNLGNVLWIRYGRTRRLDDLDDTLEALRQAEAATPEHATDRPGCLSSLAVALAERYDRTRRAEDLTECVRLLREAVAAAPPTGIDHAVAGANLGNALRMQAVARASPELRAESVAILRSTLDAAEQDGTSRAGACHNLAAALLSTVGSPPDLGDVDEAVALLQRAVTLTPEGAVDAARYRAGLGRAHRVRFDRIRDPRDYREGVEHLQAACALALDTDLELALGTARVTAGWAVGVGDREAAVRAFRVALTAVRRLVGEQVIRTHKEHWLQTAGDVHVRAAAAFLGAPGGGARDAVVALEQGRGLLLAELLDLRRADLDRLAARRDLVDRYRATAERLRTLQTTSLPRTVLQPGATGGVGAVP